MLHIIILLLYIVNIQIDVFFLPNLDFIYKICYMWSNGYHILLIFLLQFFIATYLYNLYSYMFYFLSAYVILNIFLVFQDELIVFNPSLFSIFMLFHPIILYLSYTVIFANYCNLFIYNKPSYNLIHISLILNLISLILGSMWAYNELGWGGVWYFDIVENIGLLPFISILAVFHNRNDKHMQFIWSSISIISVIISISLIRSGLLSSMHAFTGDDNGIYIFYIGLFYIFIIFSIILYKSDLRLIKNHLLIQNIAWLIVYIFILITIIYSVFIKLYHSRHMEIPFDFFIEYFTPICFIAIALMTKYNWILAVVLLLISKVEVYGYIIPSAGILLEIFYLFQSRVYRIERFLSHIGVYSSTICIMFYSLYSTSMQFTISDNIKELYSVSKDNIIEHKVDFNYEGYTYSPKVLYYVNEDKLSSKISSRSFYTYDIQVAILSINDSSILLSVKKTYCITLLWISICTSVFSLIYFAYKKWRFEIK